MKTRIISILILIFLTNLYGINQGDYVKEYTINVVGGFMTPNEVIGKMIANELRMAIHSSPQYTPSTRQKRAELRIFIVSNSLKSFEWEKEQRDYEGAAVSVTYVFFPDIVNYFALTITYAIDMDNTNKLVKGIIEKGIPVVYEHHFYKAKKIENMITKNSKSKETQTVRDKREKNSKIPQSPGLQILKKDS